MSILRYFNKAKPSEVFISIANEEKEKTAKSTDLTKTKTKLGTSKVRYKRQNFLDLETESRT